MINPENEVEILLVENDPHDAEMTLRALKKYNLCNNVIHVPDGEAALDFIFARGLFSGRLDKNKPKIILLALKPPNIDNLDVITTVKTDPAHHTTPVVVLASSQEDIESIQSYQLSVDSYIIKPVDFEKFLEAACNVGLHWALLNQTPGTQSI
jgi:two-component system response regulator